MFTTANKIVSDELIIYPALIKSDVIQKDFVEKKFRKLDSSDVPGISLALFDFLINLAGGIKASNAIFFHSFGTNVDYLNMALLSVKRLVNRGKVYLSENFPQIDPCYIKFGPDEFIKMGENELIAHQDNPYYKHGHTYIPTVKENWSQVYIVSLCSEEELQAKGLIYGYLTFTRNDAIQLCKLICDHKFSPPDANESVEGSSSYPEKHESAHPDEEVQNEIVQVRKLSSNRKISNSINFFETRDIVDKIFDDTSIDSEYVSDFSDPESTEESSLKI